MAKPVLYHNPRCSKSRETLALLLDRNVSVEVVEYLKHPLTAAEVEVLAGKLGDDARRMVRTKEAAYEDSGLDANSSVEAIARAIAKEPVLLERPILVVGDKAAIGRPPERVLGLFG
jgi:arsenate reductase (glutaredoxin)